MGSRTRVVKIGQNVWQLAQCFHIPDYMYKHVCVYMYNYTCTYISVFLISSYGAPLAQRASYLAEHSSSLWARWRS